MPITIIYRLVADEDVDLTDEFQRFRKEIFDQDDTFVDFESSTELNELLQEFHGAPFKGPYRLINDPEARLFALVATRIQFEWNDCKTRTFGYNSFLVSYGVKKMIEFFSLSGQLQTIRRNQFEAWAIPLKTDYCGLSLSLILIRPSCIGDLLNLIEGQLSVNQLNRTLHELLKQKPFHTNVLLPTIELNSDTKSGCVVNLVEGWKEALQMKDLRFKLQDGNTSILNILHSARLSITSLGIGFGNGKPQKNNDKPPCDVGTPSQMSISRLQSEKFGIRLDSPFIWIVWEKTSGISLLAGSFGGGFAAVELAQIREYTTEKTSKSKSQCRIL
ncbi:SERPIN domain-containing protein [Aphelenchoides besseyi]|nr:SERPIN domain-containing protein [Aphelenchoides besseyi]